MNSFLDGIGKVIGKIADNTQGRIERLKNEKERLLDERNKLMDVKKPFNVANANRVITIDDRVSEIDAILENKAAD